MSFDFAKRLASRRSLMQLMTVSSAMAPASVTKALL
jgi:hypothetical protein